MIFVLRYLVIEVSLQQRSLSPSIADFASVDSRTLLIDWDEIGNHFAAIHASWDPTVFDHSDTVHL